MSLSCRPSLLGLRESRLAGGPFFAAVTSPSLFGLALVPRTLTRPLIVGAVVTVVGVALVTL